MVTKSHVACSITPASWQQRQGPRVSLENLASLRCHMGAEVGIIWRPERLEAGAELGQIIGRGLQVRRLRDNLAGLSRGAGAVHTWLYGPPGSGKTAVARKVANDVCNGANRRALYVRCWEKRTVYQVIQGIVDELKILGGQAQDTNVKLDSLRRALRGKAAVVILDDIDRMAPVERERSLWTLLGVQAVAIVCISKSAEAFHSLSPATQSRLVPDFLAFPSYEKDELIDILAYFAREALTPDSWNSDVLTAVARLSSGDARVAQRLLKRTAMRADTEGKTAIAISDVQAATSAMDPPDDLNSTPNLDLHHRIILALIEKHSPILASALRHRYVEKCQAQGLNPVANRTFSKYVNELGYLHLLCVEKLGGRRLLARLGSTTPSPR